MLLALALSCLGEERLQLARPRLWAVSGRARGRARAWRLVVSARREPDETHVLFFFSYMRVETCVVMGERGR